MCILILFKPHYLVIVTETGLAVPDNYRKVDCQRIQLSDPQQKSPCL